MKRPLLLTFICALLILLFSYTAVSKILEHEKFVFQMGLSPASLIAKNASLLSITVPAIELLIAMLLLSKKWIRHGLLASMILLCLFEIYISWMMLSGSKLPCTCGGVIAGIGWGKHLVFNPFFIALSLAGLIISKKEYSTRPEARIDYK